MSQAPSRNSHRIASWCFFFFFLSDPLQLVPPPFPSVFLSSPVLIFDSQDHTPILSLRLYFPRQYYASDALCGRHSLAEATALTGVFRRRHVWCFHSSPTFDPLQAPFIVYTLPFIQPLRLKSGIRGQLGHRTPEAVLLSPYS